MNKKLACISVFVIVVTCVLTLNAEIYYPWKNVFIGALDASNWAGLVFVPERKNAFAFRIRVIKGDKGAEGPDLQYLISEVGPQAPNGFYARIKIDLGLALGRGDETPILKKPSKKSKTLILEWSRKDEKTVVGKIFVPKGVEIQIIHYFPWDTDGEYSLSEDEEISGSSSPLNSYHYLFWSHIKGEPVRSPGKEMILSFPSKKGREIFFTAGVGENVQNLRNRLLSYKNTKTIGSILDEEEKRYEKRRIKIQGLYEGVARGITNNLFWMTLYQPGKNRYYIPAGRRWIYPKPDGTQDNWTLFEWDSFFNALQTSIESAKHSKDILESVLQTQYPNGNIPNWRSESGGTPDRSQPPVGAYVVYKIFQKLGDIDFLKSSYSNLKKWHSFWKDKNSILLHGKKT